MIPANPLSQSENGSQNSTLIRVNLLYLGCVSPMYSHKGRACGRVVVPIAGRLHSQWRRTIPASQENGETSTVHLSTKIGWSRVDAPPSTHPNERTDVRKQSAQPNSPKCWMA